MHLGTINAETHLGMYKAKTHLGMNTAEIARGGISRATKPWPIVGSNVICV